jgi:hypothetical protein
LFKSAAETVAQDADLEFGFLPLRCPYYRPLPGVVRVRLPIAPNNHRVSQFDPQELLQVVGKVRRAICSNLVLSPHIPIHFHFSLVGVPVDTRAIGLPGDGGGYPH